jgi:hypothetical protein
MDRLPKDCLHVLPESRRMSCLRICRNSSIARQNLHIGGILHPEVPQGHMRSCLNGGVVTHTGRNWRWTAVRVWPVDEASFRRGGRICYSSIVPTPLLEMSHLRRIMTTSTSILWHQAHDMVCRIHLQMAAGWLVFRLPSLYFFGLCIHQQNVHSIYTTATYTLLDPPADLRRASYCAYACKITWASCMTGGKIWSGVVWFGQA